MSDGVAVAEAIHRYRFRWHTEADLQAGLAGALTDAGFTVEREVRLSAHDRVDLMVGTVAVEVKVAKGRAAVANAVASQLARYAAHPEVSALVLVTTTVRHKAMPAVMNGKPVSVVVLQGGLGR